MRIYTITSFEVCSVFSIRSDELAYIYIKERSCSVQCRSINHCWQVAQDRSHWVTNDTYTHTELTLTPTQYSRILKHTHTHIESQ